MTELEKIKRGIEKYIRIMDLIRETDVSENDEFQHLFNGFYQVRRNEEWRKVFYSFMEERKDAAPSIEEILTFLANNTPRKSVELSFASKMLHTIDSNYPIYDKKVASFLKLEGPVVSWSNEAKIEHQVKNYNAIIAWYQTSRAKSLIHLFDEIVPEYRTKIGDVKKIDFIIWRGLSDER